MPRLAGRVAIVTGGASGFGAASVRAFVREGASVVIADRDAQAGASLAGELGERALFVACDITRRDDVAAVVAATEARWGRLDILYNNAGIGWAGAFADAADAAIAQVLEVDLVGPTRMTQAALPALHRRAAAEPDPGPAILFTASGLGLRSAPDVSLYAIAKHGVVGLMRSLAAELGPANIRVNAVCPGIVDTPAVRRMWGEAQTEAALERFRRDRPLRRDLLVDDIAQAALFLVSPEARMISGVSLVVDGGRLGI